MSAASSAPLWGRDAERLAAIVARGEASAVEVVEACLERTRETEPVVGAYLEVWGEAARQRAAALDDARRRGEPPGPLAGVPVAVKDNLAVAGRLSTAGSRILEGFRAPESATVVERLLEAGAVPVGRTNLDEFGMGSSTERSAFGPTRNPWDPERVPGGSSGGSAAAVAAGGVPVALGSDTGGSVRQPAALCGVVGMKPTWGRISRYGLTAFASSLDQVGLLARTVRDVALLLEVVAGPDPRDATAAARPAESYLGGIEDGVEGWTVGTLSGEGVEGLDAAVTRCWQGALGHLRAAGCEVVALDLPDLDRALAAYQVLAAAEASSNLQRYDGIRYGRREPGSDAAAVWTGSRGRGFGPEVKLRILLGALALSGDWRERLFDAARAVRREVTHRLEDAFTRVDVLALPAALGGAFRLGALLDDAVGMVRSDLFTAPASLAGLPAVVVPCGRDAHRMPLALQIVGPPWAEGRILRAARALERAVGWDVEPARPV